MIDGIDVLFCSVTCAILYFNNWLSVCVVLCDVSVAMRREVVLVFIKCWWGVWESQRYCTRSLPLLEACPSWTEVVVCTVWGSVIPPFAGANCTCYCLAQGGALSSPSSVWFCCQPKGCSLCIVGCLLLVFGCDCVSSTYLVCRWCCSVWLVSCQCSFALLQTLYVTCLYMTTSTFGTFLDTTKGKNLEGVRGLQCVKGNRVMSLE